MTSTNLHSSMEYDDAHCVQVTGTVVDLFIPCKVRVLQLQHLGHHRSLGLETRVLILLQLTLVVHWYVTQIVRMCGWPSREDNETCCHSSQMLLRTTVSVLLQQGTMQCCSINPTGSMITLDIITTLPCLAPNLSVQRHWSMDLLYSNSINCSVSVIVTFTLCCTFSF